MEEYSFIQLPAQYNAQLPDPNVVQFYRDLDERIIWMDHEITNDSLWIVSKILDWNKEDIKKPINKRKPIRIFFDSVGGDLDIGQTISSIIELSKTPIYGIAVNLVASAASIIYLSCHVRYACPNAYWILHKGFANMSGDYNSMMQAMEDYQRQIDQMIEFYKTHTRFKEEEILANIEKDWYIHADEAKQNGICNEIVADLDMIL